jgi:hypothetical protein
MRKNLQLSLSDPVSSLSGRMTTLLTAVFDSDSKAGGIRFNPYSDTASEGAM